MTARKTSTFSRRSKRKLRFYSILICFFWCAFVLIKKKIFEKEIAAKFLLKDETALSDQHENEFIFSPENLIENISNHTEISENLEIVQPLISLSLDTLGSGYEIPKNISSELQKIIDEGFKLHGFNQYASDQIPVRRPLLDGRSEQCKMATENYSKNLPPTSVIVIFYNEAWSTLLRTVYSILDKSPDHLITEIILVDDCSELAHLKQPLDDFMSKLPKVKIIRNQQREGLIRARIAGAVAAKGPVLTFLDSHVECTPGWLEPLLDRIAGNSTNVACPMIKKIKKDTFEFKMDPLDTVIHVGSFRWDLMFHWQRIPDEERRKKAENFEPVESPTMAGGLFTVSKEFFERLGMYDPEFSIWGGENLELSFKTWMCGGRLEIIPCSSVGHVFRKIPYDYSKNRTEMRVNLYRLAAVWMDDYAKYFYQTEKHEKVEVGDISDRVKLRQNLNCKSFKWYVENVYPTLEIPDNFARGFVKSLVDESKCLYYLAPKHAPKSPVGIANCEIVPYFEYTKKYKIKAHGHCLGFEVQMTPHEDIQFSRCEDSISQKWVYDNTTNLLVHDETEKCLTIDQKLAKVSLEVCNKTNSYQKWGFKIWDWE